jgi:VWFA-related protein
MTPERPTVKSLAPAVVLLTGSVLLAAGTPTSVRISTIVTDKNGKPVPGLSLKDFELRENGVVQKLDAVEARRAAPRQVAILLDEFHVDAADTDRVRDAVARFVADDLRPEDALVILKPLEPLSSIRLTSDRAAAQRAIAAFTGREGNFEPRNGLEEETLGRTPALVAAGRAQIVLSALRALAARLGTEPGRSAIFLVSDGFTQPRRGYALQALPDVAIVDRFANRYDVPIYVFDPGAPGAAAENAENPENPESPGVAILTRLARDTGGAVFRGDDLGRNLANASVELDGGYTLTYTPSHDDDGHYHPVQVTIATKQKRGADARARAGYIAPESADALRAARAAEDTPLFSTRALHRSPLIDVWSAPVSVTATDGHVTVAWEPGAGTRFSKSGPVRVALKATTPKGMLLFEGVLSAVRPGEASSSTDPDRAEFEAPAGRVQLDMTILGLAGEKLDVDARDFEVPALKGAAPLMLPAVIIPTASAREFRDIWADPKATPDPSREFRRTDRLVVRVSAYAGGAVVPVAGRLLNALAQSMRDLAPQPGGNAVTQFDVPLASLAAGDYFLLFTVKGPSGPVDQRVPIRITG